MPSWGGAQQVATVVQIEIDTVERATDVVVAQHALGPIAKRQYGNTLCTNGHLAGHAVHVGIRTAVGSDIALAP